MTTTENIRKELQDLVDSKYQEFHSALVPGIGNILGVRIPQLRILAKEIAKRDNWRMFVEATDTKFYEETMLQAIPGGEPKKSFFVLHYIHYYSLRKTIIDREVFNLAKRLSCYSQTGV